MLPKSETCCSSHVLTISTQHSKRTTASEQRKLQLLFTSEELGYKKPTQLLRRMQQLLGDHPAVADESFLRELFLQRLPPNVTMVLASIPESTSLDKLAEQADLIIEVATPTGSIVVTLLLPTFLPKYNQHLQEEVSRLEKLVRKLSHSSRSTSRRTNQSPRHSPTPHHITHQIHQIVTLHKIPTQSAGTIKNLAARQTIADFPAAINQTPMPGTSGD